MRPRLHPALSRVWRDDSTLQFGLGPAHAVVLGGLGTVEIALLNAMNGHHDLAALRAVAAELGGASDVADRLVEALTTAGAIVDDALLHDVDTEPSGRRDRRLALGPDRAALALVDRRADAGGTSMRERHTRRVDVIGAGRVGAGTARLLVAAGIGEVCVEDPAPVTPADLSPGGLAATAIGLPRHRAVADAMSTDAPSMVAGAVTSATRATPPATHPATPPADPDLVIVADPVHAREHAHTLLRRGTTHLLAQVVEVAGIVGPLVVPGRTSCVRCHDLHRTDRDAAWPLVLDRYGVAGPEEPPCDVALAASVAALAASQALAHLDGFRVATVDGTLETTLPYGLTRRRSWRTHPACGCAWN